MSLLQRVEAARQATATPEKGAVPGSPGGPGGTGRPWVAVPIDGGQPPAPRLSAREEAFRE